MLINTWKALFLEHLAIKSSIIDKKNLRNDFADSFTQAIFTSYQRLKKRIHVFEPDGTCKIVPVQHQQYLLKTT